MKWNKWLNEYFRFTRKDRTGLGILVILLLAVIFVPRWMPDKASGITPVADTAWNRARLQVNSQDENGNYDNEYKQPRYSRNGETKNTATSAPTLFYFDPNTLEEAGWSRLGLRDKTIATIIHFREKGGKFRSAADLKKIYGLYPDEESRLEPYVRITQNQFSGESNQSSEEQHFMAAGKRPAYQPYQSTEKNLLIDINQSDSVAWESLPGIGPKLASRILHFREALGGFYTVEQVKETFGLADSVYQKISAHLQLTTPVLRKININTITVDELKLHPYFRWAMARSVIAFRESNGPFAKPDDLKKIMAVTDEWLQKISPYLRF